MHIDDIEDNAGLLDESEVTEEESETLIPIAGRIIQTPFGAFEIDDKYNPLRQFEFRIGHTNFDITKNVFNIIEKTEGVAALIVISRYSFIIGLGKLFTFEDVRKDIEHQLLDDPPSSELAHAANELEAKYPYWCLYLFPNGEMEKFGSDNFEEYEQQLAVLTDASKLSNGLLLTYED